MNSQDVVITTPTNCSFHGCSVVEESNIVAISIIRAGDSMLESFMNVAPNCLVGKILIQRDESTKEPVLFYSKLPSLVGKHVALLDPMLATGGSAACAVRVLLLHGAKEEDITFVNVIACPEGLKRFTSEFPGISFMRQIVHEFILVGIRVVSGCVDEGLNENVCLLYCST